MDKARLNGNSKVILSAALMVTVLLVSGCETTKGLARGISQDSQDLWNFLKQADDWVKENLW